MKVTAGGTDVSRTYRPPELTNFSIDLIASDGEVGNGVVPLPDSAGAEWQAGTAIHIEDGSGPTTIIDGFLGGQTTDRPEPLIGRRVHHFVLQDGNRLLYGQRAASWKRPAETDQARVLAAAAAYWPTLDTSWVLGTNTATLPAKTYDTDTLFSELMSDVKLATSKTLYVENGRLHSHETSEGQAAGFAIGEASAPYTTTFPIREGTATRTRDDLVLVNDVMMRNSAGARYTETDATSISEHDAGGLKHQAIVDAADATVAQLPGLAAGYLAVNKEERYTYEGVIGPLTAAQAALLIPGCLATCTQAVWGVTAATLRLARVTLTYLHPSIWYAHVYMANPIRYRYLPTGPGLGTGAACRVTIGTGFVPIDSADGAYPAPLCGGYDNTMGSRLFCHDEGVGNPCGLGSALFWGSIIQGREQKSNGYTVPAGAVLAHVTAHVTTDDGVFGTAGAHGWQEQFVLTVPGGYYDGITIIGPTLVADSEVECDIPANLFTPGQPVYFIAVPSWQEQERTVCGSEGTPFPGGDYLTTGAVDDVTWTGFCAGARGMSDWVGGTGTQDGTNATFGLVAWTGQGSPQVKVNGLVATIASTDTSALTVTLETAPAPTDIVLYNYEVQN